MIAARRNQAIYIRGENPLLHALQEVQERVNLLRVHVRDFCYSVVLFQKPCPKCRATVLRMVRDGLAMCEGCGNACDPTRAFQACPLCDSTLVRKTCHYWCPRCRQPVRSLYCIEARVFDAAYFRQKMHESRVRKREREVAAQTGALIGRSDLIPMPEPVPTPGLEIDLNTIIAAFVPESLRRAVAEQFNLEAYRRHLLDLVDGCIVQFEGISPLMDNARLDRVFRFVAAIFLEHEGLLSIEQKEGGRLRLVGQ